MFKFVTSLFDLIADLMLVMFIVLVIMWLVALNTFNPIEAAQFHMTDSFVAQNLLIMREYTEDLVAFVQNVIA